MNRYNIENTDLSKFPVLLWIPEASDIFGGHIVQFERTAEYLRALGWNVTTDFTPNADLSKYKVVHGLGLSPAQIVKCKQLGAVVVLSTLFCTEYVYPTYRAKDWLKQKLIRTKVAAECFMHIVNNSSSAVGLKLAQTSFAQKARYEVADILLPNSKMEGSCVINDLAVNTPQVVVPNSADRNIFQITEPWEKRQDIVAYCGRIEPHKNQLNLIRAAKIAKVSLLIIGPAHPDHARYYDTCIKEAQGHDVKFLAMQQQQDLVALYNSAKVHACPSWFETTGLVSLEAALCGCSIVSTNKGYASEYFGEDAEFCDPGKVADIARAIKSALMRPPSPAFIERVKEDFCWERTAEKTSEAYLTVLANAPKVTVG